jgi:hypothetical protein
MVGRFEERKPKPNPFLEDAIDRDGIDRGDGVEDVDVDKSGGGVDAAVVLDEVYFGRS